MADFLPWIKDNWFSLLQTVGILGSLWFTGASLHHDSETRQVANLLTMSERHRILWDEAYQRPELARVFKEDAILSAPPTLAEREFLNLVIVHFETGWRVANATDKEELRTLARDAGEFFSLPLPRAVWDKTKAFRNPKFVRFVERALESV
jgi:hypothetical protein